MCLCQGIKLLQTVPQHEMLPLKFPAEVSGLDDIVLRVSSYI